MKLLQLMKKHPVASFYILTFLISWSGYIPQVLYSYGLFPFQSMLFFIIGGLGPAISAIIVMHVLHRKNGVRKIFRALYRWRCSILWYVVALFLYAFIWLAVIAIPNGVSLNLEKIPPWYMLIPFFIANMFMNVWEEIGWRGFALPELQSNYTALTSSIIVGAMWGLWHLPLLIMKDYPMSDYPILPFFIGVIASSLLYTWIYNNTQGSLLIVTIFHASGNTVGYFLGDAINNIPALITYKSAVTSFIAVAVIILYGKEHLSRSFKRFYIS